jgi:hypothetical protein
VLVVCVVVVVRIVVVLVVRTVVDVVECDVVLVVAVVLAVVEVLEVVCAYAFSNILVSLVECHVLVEVVEDLSLRIRSRLLSQLTKKSDQSIVRH